MLSYCVKKKYSFIVSLILITVALCCSCTIRNASTSPIYCVYKVKRDVPYFDPGTEGLLNDRYYGINYYFGGSRSKFISEYETLSFRLDYDTAMDNWKSRELIVNDNDLLCDLYGLPTVSIANYRYNICIYDAMPEVKDIHSMIWEPKESFILNIPVQLVDDIPVFINSFAFIGDAFVNWQDEYLGVVDVPRRFSLVEDNGFELWNLSGVVYSDFEVVDQIELIPLDECIGNMKTSADFFIFQNGGKEVDKILGGELQYVPITVWDFELGTTTDENFLIPCWVVYYTVDDGSNNLDIRYAILNAGTGEALYTDHQKFFDSLGDN